MYKERIVARLQHPELCYSPVTVVMVNSLAKFMRVRQLSAFLKENCTLKWTKTRHDKFWSPVCLQKTVWNSEQQKYIKEYCFKNYNFKASLERHLNIDSTGGILMSYSTRATSILPFIKKKDTDLFFGTELEYEGRNDTNLKKTHELVKDFAIIKRDGSLRNGLEICTAPMCFESHEVFKKFFETLPEGLTAADTTGMHIHISKSPLSFLQLGKMFKLLNTPEYEAWIVRIAGRNKNRFCETDNVSFPLSYPFLHSEYATRYRRVNLTNRDTIEIRMFSTPMTYENYHMKLELCKALVDFCNPGNVSIKDTNLDKFKGFIVDNRKVYHNLAKEV